MAFQVSVTHWFLLTPFCHRAVVVSRGRRESSQRRKGRRWSGAEGERRNMVGAGGWERERRQVSGTQESGAGADNRDAGIRTVLKGKEQL